MYLLFYMAHGLTYLRRANPLLGPLKGGRPWKYRIFLWPKLLLLRSLLFLNTKMSRILGPTPSNGPCYGFSRIKIITGRPGPCKEQEQVITSPGLLEAAWLFPQMVDAVAQVFRPTVSATVTAWQWQRWSSRCPGDSKLKQNYLL
jgi:hypothetical protein